MSHTITWYIHQLANERNTVFRSHEVFQDHVHCDLSYQKRTVLLFA